MNKYLPPKDAPDSVVEIHPGLFAIGGGISLDLSPIWMPANSRGWLPMQCYALRDRDRFILIDSATGVLRKEVREGVCALAAGATERRTLMTRREPDCAMNLPELISEIDISLVECTSEINPLEFYSDLVSAKFDDANTEALVSAGIAATLAKFRMTKAGEKIGIGAFNFEMLRAPIRVLSGSWIYENNTRTLFCSDNFGFLTSDRPSRPRSVAPTAAEVSVERILEFMAVKFDYLIGADTPPIMQALTQLASSRPIDRLCPSYGLVIEGRDAVQSVIENTMVALEKLGAMPRLSEMSAFKANLARTGASARL